MPEKPIEACTFRSLLEDDIKGFWGIFEEHIMSDNVFGSISIKTHFVYLVFININVKIYDKVVK